DFAKTGPLADRITLRTTTAPDTTATAKTFMRLDPAELAERWEACCKSLGTPEARQEILGDLVAAYTAPDRHYHDIGHIISCLRELDGVRRLARNPVALELAIWFHDVIYDGRQQDNEER